ncbi:MAG TPA: hypothetical protein VEA78_13835 [Acidimicrobiales bacterium]|nr:hypothetical protein [Acidimicrobiales bacterium]
MRVDEIPVAHTPPGGYGDVMPPPVLDGCSEALAAGAPDLRGLWRITACEANPSMIGHLQRIEQAGDRLIVTSGGVVHDMRCDGTEANGVHDVSPNGMEVHVVATFEDGVHVLRPIDLPVEVRRWLEGDELVWDYAGMFVARLERIG